LTHISAFDLDRTLIRGNSAAAFCRYLCKCKVLPAKVLLESSLYYLRHHWMGMSLRELHISVFDRLLRGKPIELMEYHVDKFVELYLNKALYMPAFAHLKRAQHLGHYTMILSNSPNFIVKSFAKFLGVNEYHATVYEVDKEKRLSEISHILEGRDKAVSLHNISERLGIIRKAITVYSDSWLDLDFLKAAGTPVAVNPDKRLRAFSSQNQWQII